MKIEGIVVKVTQNQIVLLCPENGSFKNVPRSKGQFPLIGGRFVYEEKAKVFPSLRWAKYSAVICLFALVFFLYNIVFQPEQAHASAYVVAIDINPSIEVYADKKLMVTNLKALNKDGEKVIGRIAYKGKSLSDTMKLIINQCVKDQYLKPNTTGMIATTIIPFKDNDQVISQALGELKSVIKETLSENVVYAEVTVSMDSMQTLKDAQQLDISVNKYKVYSKLKAKGIEVTLEKVKGTPIKELLKMQQETSSMIPSTTPKKIPSAAQQERTPSATPSAVPQERTPSATPSEAPQERIPSAMPKMTPSAAPQERIMSSAREATPSATPEGTPSATPEETPSATPEATPSAAPEATPSAAPEATPSAAPEETPSAAPEVTPSAAPEATPSAAPEATPTAAP